MMDPGAAEELSGDVALLERAISYALGNLHNVTQDALTRPTPCRQWDLRELLEHMYDSLAALQEASDDGHVALGPVPWHADPAANLVAALRSRAGRLLGAWARPGAGLEGGGAGTAWAGAGPVTVSVGGVPAPAGLLAGAGAVEIAVHGWDVGQACGRPSPIPPQLATEMLALVPLIVTDADRPARFAEPVWLPAGASPGDRLVAYLGRPPG